MSDIKKVIIIVAAVLIAAGGVGALILTGVIDIGKNDPSDVTPSGGVNTPINNSPAVTLPDGSVDDSIDTEYEPSLTPVTDEEILLFAKNAIAKTKAYMDEVEVHHVQSFEGSITEVPGGDVVRNIANKVMEGMAKPVDETLKFKEGKAKGTTGNTLVMLLPQDTAFSLQMSGVADASVSTSGDNTVIELTLINETGTMDVPPVHHSTSVGYMNAASIDFGVVKITKFDVNYYCTKMIFTINSDGYVVSAEYDIPFKVDLTGEVMKIPADVKLEGRQTEKWEFKWIEEKGDTV